MTTFVNHGRWLVDCSADDCQAVLFADRPLFPEDNYGTLSLRCICNDESVCDHPSIPCGAPIVAVFPDNKGDIDVLMNRRPRRENRNWKPGETVDQLKRENLLQGVRI